MTNNDLTGVLKTLRYRLALLVLAGLAPVAAHQCYHLVSDRGAQLQAARERSAEIARAGVERFGDAVREAQTVLELMAKVPVVSDGTPERCGDFLRDIERDRPWANGLWVVGENERVICTSVPNGLGVVTSQRPWYRHAVAAKGFTLSDFFIGQVRGVPASNAALPAVAPGSGARQVYAVTMDLSWFGRVAEAIGAKNNAQVTLVDGNGVVLARYPDGERLVGNNFSGHPLIEAGLKQSSGLYEGLDLDGQDRIFSVVALQNTRTHLIVGLDRAQILAAMDAETTWTVLILTAIGALMSMLAWIGGRRIFVAPMETIAGTLQVTLDHIDQGLIMVDAAGRVRVCNRRAQELLDLPDHVIAGQPSFASLVGYQIERGEFETFGDPEALWSAKGGFEGKPRVYERVRPNGRILEISTVPLAGGGAVRTYTDVTDRRAVEQAARQSEEHIRALIDALPQKIWTTRPDGAASYHNRQMIAYHGGSGSGLADWVEASHPDDRERVQKVRDEAMAAGRAFTVEVRLRDAAGAYRWHLLSTAPIQRRGAIVEWVGTSVDIHRIKDTEQALAETTKRADEARRHAEAASDAKTEFLASMSHEIRTPLNGVLGYTELLLSGGPLTEDQRRAIDHIRNAGEALLTVVNDILDFSRIEAGQIDLEPRTFATRNLVDQSLSIVESLAAAKRLDLRADLDPALPPVLVGDDTRVRQVLLNLLNNAIKFTRNGGVMLKISVVEVGTAQTLLRFAVTDTGIGIPADKLPRLFQRFSQVDGSVQREFGGSGLGLAICKRLIERMGGEIGVESREFEGSTFWFTVPFGVGAGQDLLDLAMDAPVPQASRPARILLAEDIRMNQELACAVLTRAGHSVDVVADGTEALMAVQEAHYDLVLMDVQMPVMDGITATRRIRAMDGPQARIPIIAMTANVLPAQVAAFAEAGMNDHIGKPFRRGQLLDAVDRWCAGAGPAGVEAEPDRKSGAEAASFDRAIYDGLAEIVGPEMLSNWISDLRARIATAEACMRTPDDRDALARAAHALVSVSGMMGFMRLSDRSSALEQACPAGSDPGAALRLVHEEGRQVLATLDELDAAGAAAPLRAAG